MVTETPAIAEALEVAARRWPEVADDRAALIKKLLAVGSATVASGMEQERAHRVERIRAGAGSLPGMFPPNARDTLLDDWPD